MTGTKVLFIILIVLGALQSKASDSSSNNQNSQPQPTPTPFTVREAGKPIIAKFHDGNEAVLTVKKEETAFTTSLALTENACMPQQTASCKIVFPHTLRIYAWIWTKNAQGNVGKTLMRSYSSNRPAEAYQFASHTFPFVEGKGRLRKSSTTSPFAEMKCNDNDWLPWSKQLRNGRRATTIVNWEEDFELQNEEFLYRQGGETPSFNSISSRFEDVVLIETADKRILLGPRGVGVNGFGGALSFPLVAYKLQLTFNHQSLADADDRMCQLKMTADFAAAFTQFSKFFDQNAKPWHTQEFTPVITDSADDAAIPPYQRNNAWYGSYL